jgi:hypothetical protein
VKNAAGFNHAIKDENEIVLVGVIRGEYAIKVDGRRITLGIKWSANLAENNE